MILTRHAPRTTPCRGWEDKQPHDSPHNERPAATSMAEASFRMHETHNSVPYRAQKSFWVCVHTDHDHLKGQGSRHVLLKSGVSPREPPRPNRDSRTSWTGTTSICKRRHQARKRTLRPPGCRFSCPKMRVRASRKKAGSQPILLKTCTFSESDITTFAYFAPCAPSRDVVIVLLALLEPVFSFTQGYMVSAQNARRIAVNICIPLLRKCLSP